MRKKLIAVIMTALLAFASAAVLSGCDDTEQQASEETTTSSVQTDETSAVAEVTEITELAGDWQDTVSQRATMTIVPASDGKSAEITVMWSESASETNQWVMTAGLEGSRLVYDTCRETETEYNSDGSIDEEETSTEEGGYFEIGASGEINWTGAEDDDCRTCSFEKVTE